jgi:3-hydroxyacyl-[acyl-carrier-protein] dehydratase
MTPALLAAPVVLLEQQGLGATAIFDVDGREWVFAGHYPGFPVLPGVCVIDTVRRAADLARPEQAQRSTLDSVESARFIEPVFPGDRMLIALRWESNGNPGDWRCAAAVSVRSSKVSTVRLRYVSESQAA